MVDIAGSSSADESSGKKKNFIGRIVRSAVDDPEGNDNEEYATDLDLLAEIEPLTEYDNHIFQYGMDVRESFGSKWQLWIGHFENVHGPIEELGIGSLEELCEFLEGNVYEWRDINFMEDEEFTWEHAANGGRTYNIKDLFSNMTNKPKNMLVPVREVSQEEVQELTGEVDTSEIEEAEF